MSTMLKSILAATTALTIAGGSLVYAQQRPQPGANERPRVSAADVVALGDARIAALKAGLKLTAEQEKNWPALEKALKDAAKLRSERFAARASADKPAANDPIARWRTYGEFMSERGASLKAIADAAAPLYQSLDDAQKQRFVMLAHVEGRDFMRGSRHRHRGFHRGGPGDGMGPRGGMGPRDGMGPGLDGPPKPL